MDMINSQHIQFSDLRDFPTFRYALRCSHKFLELRSVYRAVINGGLVWSKRPGNSQTTISYFGYLNDTLSLVKREQFTCYNKHFTCSPRAPQLELWLSVSAMIWPENPQDEHLDLVLLTNHKLWSKCQKPPSLLPTSWKKAASHPTIVRYFPGLSTSTGQEAKPPPFFSATLAWTRPQANSDRCICIDIQAQLSTHGIWYSSKPYE